MDTQTIAALITLSVYLIDLLVLLYLIYENRDPAATAFWALTIFTLPLLGVIIFFFFGRDWRNGTARSRKEVPLYEIPAKKFFPAFYKNYESFNDDFFTKNEGHWLARLARLTKTVNSSPVFPAETIKILPCGEVAFDALKKDMRNAEHSIHMSFFYLGKR
jgi:cardiolipin synthase